MKKTRIIFHVFLFFAALSLIEPAYSYNGAFHPDSLKIKNGIIPQRKAIAQKTAQDFGSQLTNTGVSKSDTDWSPDGKNIAYSQDGDIYIMSPQGSSPKNLTLPDEGYCFEPVFSADGQGVFYSRWDYTYLNYTVQYIGLDGLNNTLIVNSALLGVQSPDGKLFIYKSYPESDLILYNQDLGTTRIIAVGDSLYGSSCFSPDSKFVITSMKSKDGTKKLFQIPVIQTNVPKQITFGDGNHDYPDFSPFGKWILYSELDIGDIWALNVPTGEQRIVFPDSEFANYNAHFSPNGLRFEYLLDTSGVYEIWIADFPFAQSVVKSINITSPVGNENLLAGKSHSITWTSQNVSTVKILYTTDGGINWTQIASGVNASSGTYSWTVPNIPSSRCMVSIVDESDNTIISTSPGNFTISIPSIKVTSPNGGESFQGGTSQTITWEYANIESVMIEFSSDSGSSWDVIGSGIDSSLKSYTLIIPNDINSEKCLIRISSSTDSKITDMSDNYFTIDSIASSITVKGSLSYQGKLINLITQKIPETYVYDYITGESFYDAAINYDSSTGIYTLVNPPTDYPGIEFFFHINDDNLWLAGDYVGYIEADLSASSISHIATEDVNLYKIIHMNSPADNSLANISYDNKPVYKSPLFFEWEPIDGAHVYDLVISRNRDANHPDGEGYIEDVDAQFDYSGTSYSSVLPNSLPNEYYSVTIYAYDVDYSLIGLYLVSYSEPDYYDYYLGFRIYNEILVDKSIEILTPDGGEILTGGSSYDITWSMTGVNSVNIGFSPDNGVSWLNVASSLIPASGSQASGSSLSQYKFTWTVPDISSGSSLIRILGVADASVFDRSDNTFTIIKSVAPVMVKWKYKTNDAIEFSSPALGGDGSTYIGSNDGNLYAIDISGNKKWSIYLGDAVWSSPTVTSAGIIYIGSFDRNLYAIGTQGDIKWKYSTEAGIISTPAISSDSTIVFGSYDNNLYALYPDGKLRWKKNLGGTVYSSPAIGIDRTIYIGDNQGFMYAFEPNGNEKWKYQTGDSIFSSPAIGSDGTVYVGSSNGSIYALNPNGTQKWSIPLGAVIESSPVIDSDGNIIIGTEGNNFDISPKIYKLDKDGLILWKFESVGNIISTPAVGADGTIYVGSADGTFYAITGDGKLNWEYPAGSAIWSSPAISKTGIIVFGAYDGNIYALDSETNQGLASSSWPKFHNTNGNIGRIMGVAADFVRVASPNGGENIVPGTSYPITWNSNGVNNILIEYSSDNGLNWYIIADNIPSSNLSYNWTIPQGISSSQCLVGITSKDNNTITDSSNTTFTISQAAFVRVTSPNGGEIINANTAAVITWQYYGVGEVEIQYTKTNGITWSTIATVSASNSSFSWTVPGDISSNCRIRITDTSNSAIMDESDGNFSIASNKFITLKSPSLGEKWSTGSTKDIRWEFSNVSKAILEYSIDNGQTWIKIIDSVSTDSGLYSWVVPIVSSDQCLIKISDFNDPSVFDLSDKFGITQPELSIEHTPISEAKENERITFNALVTCTGEIGEVNLYYDVTGRRTFENHITMNLKQGSTYSATLTEGVFTGMGMEYFIAAADKDKKQSRSPADVGYYSIKAIVNDLRSSKVVAGGSVQNSYRMISIPLDLKTSSITEQLQGRMPTGESGPDWRLFRYPEGVTTPNEYPNIEGFSPGKAFWLISKSNYQLMTPEGTTVTTAEPFTITLKAGWNDIANPWLFDISWDDIENPSGADLSSIYTYEGNWSDPSISNNILEPWKGYSVNNLSNMNVVIRLKPRPAEKTVSKLAVQNEQVNWMITINAQAGLAGDYANYFGTRSGASGEWDKFDHIEPYPVGDYVSVFFPHNDWVKYPHEYTVDFRPKQEKEISWDFNVKINIINENVIVKFDSIDNLPEGMKYEITDLDSGNKIVLDNNDSFNFLSGKTLTERHFRFTASENMKKENINTVKPGVYLTAQCYPNPFNPSTTIHYELFKPGIVTVSVYNSLGQRVMISEPARKETGSYDLIFDASGLTSGLYLYRIQCGQASVTGKMLFMK